MDQELEIKTEIIDQYKKTIEPLLRYLPWLESKVGSRISQSYTNHGLSEKSLPFPVFDSTFLGMIKEFQRSGLMDKNYAYVYSRHGIKNIEDEKKLIESATVKDIPILLGILSRYVMGGMTKAGIWDEGIEAGIIYLVLRTLKEVLDFWDGPLA